MTPINARFAGVCSLCGGAFPVGHPILWSKGSRPQHRAGGCLPAAQPAPAASAVVPPAVVRSVIAQAAAGARLTPPAPGYVPAPAFEAVAGETRDQLGHRALLFVLAHGPVSLWRLTAEGLSEAIRAIRAAIARLPGKDGTGLAETFAAVLVTLRAEEACRAERREAVLAALQAQADAMDAAQGGGAGAAADASQPAPDAGNGPAGGGSGGGGSKVPRRPKPAPKGPTTALPMPAAPVPVGVPAAVAVPAGVAMLQPLPASTLGADDLF